MYIRRVVLENIRGFEELDFSFEHPSGDYCGWNVITGDNGSGKSAFLRAIALALVGLNTARVLLTSTSGWIRKGSREGTIAVQLVAGPHDKFTGGRRYEAPFWSELNFVLASDNKATIKPGQKYLRQKRGPTRGPWLDSPDGWFCAGYGPFRRLYGHSPEAQRLMSAQGKVSRFATLFREDATLAEGDLWLRDLRYKELEKRDDAGETLRVVLNILNYHFLRHGIKVDRVDAEGLWLKQADGVVLSLESMSDGYRAAIAMVVDILRQLIEVYGLNGFQTQDSGSPLIEYSGVVLVDEIDAHLHPAWQREIGEWFKSVFPNIQFINTSHSPLICQAASEKGIFHLPAPGSQLVPFQLTDIDYHKVIASRPNEIYLSPAFGLTHTRSPRAVRAREEFAQLQAKKQTMALSGVEVRKEEQLKLFATIEDSDEEAIPHSAAH